MPNTNNYSCRCSSPHIQMNILRIAFIVWFMWWLLLVHTMYIILRAQWELLYYTQHKQSTQMLSGKENKRGKTDKQYSFIQHAPSSIRNSTLLFLTKTKQRCRERRDRLHRVERHFLNWVGQSDQEGAIECVSVREREKERKNRETETEVEEEEQRRGRRRREGSVALHNRPRHECSSTLVSTHPLQFQLSNGTSDSRHPLTLCTKDGRVRAQEQQHTRAERHKRLWTCAGNIRAHTKNAGACGDGATGGAQERAR